MQAFKTFLKRNAPVFVFGLIIILVFTLIILTQPRTITGVPAGFKRVEEEIFNREPAEPTPEEKPTVYAPQSPSPENIGKPYFYGEYDPNLRDEQGYPMPPKTGTTPIPPNSTLEDKMEIDMIERDNYAGRTKTVYIDFTEAGFKPADTMGFTGQKIIWTNKSAGTIQIKQTVPIHESLKNGVTLKPGESFEFRPLVTKEFTYVEVSSGKYGSLFIGDVTQPLISGLTGD